MTHFFSAKIKIFIIWLCLIPLLFANQIAAQDIKYARNIIEKLCAPSLHGRGYVAKGDKKASAYIVSELKRNNIKSFGKSYEQLFAFPINTFPGKAKISIDGVELKGGIDFLIEPSSPSFKGENPLLWIDSTLLKDTKKIFSEHWSNKPDCFAVIDLSKGSYSVPADLKRKIVIENLLQAEGVVKIVDKLTYGAASWLSPFPAIQIKKGALKSNNSKLKLEVENKFYNNYTSRNVVGYIEGETDSLIVLTAHYDHLGRMGKDVYFPGAHDNASGVALVLDIARHLSKLNEKPHYSIAFIFFSGEEAGLHGSFFFANNPLFPLSKIRFLLNLDLMGSGEDGIQVVNATVFKDDFQVLSEINEEKKYLTQIKLRGAAANSDHYPFYKKGVHCFFAYTLGAYKEYHNIYDNAENVPLNAYENLFKLFVDFITEI